ncbi:MAG: hypothetical protein IKS19_06875 [Clostridia bacterium]|nr:hypothetical protein [Clostridia bacterium]
MYDTEFDHSEIIWYLSQNYGAQAADNYYYYDFGDSGEESFLFAQKINRKIDGPQYVIHAFNAGMEDWYLYDNIVLEACECTASGKTDDGRDVIKAVFYYEYEEDPFTVYIVPAKNGRIEKLLYCWGDESENYVIRKYDYNKNGRITAATSYESEYYDALFGEIEGYAMYTAYSYNAAGALTELTVVSKTFDNGKPSDEKPDYVDHRFISYDEDGNRTVMASDDSWVYPTSLSYTRNADGLVQKIVCDIESDNPWSYTVDISYLPGGVTEYSESY